MLTSPVYVGLDNYRTVLRDPEFRTALFNTVAITIPHIVLRLVFALALALALNSNIRYRAFYRVLFFLPVLTMPVAIGTIWKWLYDPAFGPINSFLRRIGVAQPEWLSQPRWAVVAVVIVLLWSGVGYDMIIYLAGLAGDPARLPRSRLARRRRPMATVPRYHLAAAHPDHLLPLGHRGDLLAASLRPGLRHDPHRPDQHPAHRRLLHL